MEPPILLLWSGMKATSSNSIVRALLLVAVAAFAADRKSTPLDEFIRAADSHYRYEQVKTIPGEGYTAYVLDLTSQAWPPGAELTDHPIWKHWLTVIKPDRVEGATGFLF